jgi:hypothetical protein
VASRLKLLPIQMSWRAVSDAGERSIELQNAAAKVREWINNPVAFVRDNFHVEPDIWQAETMMSLRHGDSWRRRIGMKSCTGAGKSTVLAWIGWYRLTCYADKGEHPKGAALSGEGRDNLRDNLWSELSKWQERSEFLRHTFQWTKEQIFNKESPTTWFLSARSYPKDADPEAIGRSLSGLHSKYPFILLDEIGDMPLAVGQKAEQIFTGGVIDGLIAAAGNPTSTSGLLYQVCTKLRTSWDIITITADPNDIKRTSRVDIEHAREQIEKYGRDNPWVMATILGEFPPSGFNSLISLEEVEAAMNRRVSIDKYEFAQKRIGVDVARFGCFDDKTEILTNEGWKYFSELTGHELVVSCDQNKRTSEYKEIQQVHKYPFDGYLNTIENNKQNFSITDNHNLWVRSCPASSKTKLERYDSLPKAFVAVGTVGWSGQSKKYIKFKTEKLMPNGGFHRIDSRFLMSDWAEFLGWFISEGNVYREKRHKGRLRICIAQRKEHNRLKIVMLLDRMGIKWRLISNGNQIEFSSMSIGKHLIDECGIGASKKKIPRYIKDGSEEIINIFLESFCLGDGSKKANGMGRTYYTTSKQLANDIQECLAKVGRAGFMAFKKSAGTKFMIEGREATRKYDIHIVYEKRESKDVWLLKENIKKLKYSGFVYCVSTEYKTILVRRNGVVMWSGNSDRSCLFPRQGLMSYKPVIMRGATTNEIAARVMQAKNRWASEIELVDDTGGYGAGVIDFLSVSGQSPIGINFGGKAIDPRYKNKRAEMWFGMADWVKRGGSLPDMPELIAELTGPTYTFDNQGKFMLESKDQIKERLGYSPDIADALCLTFALPEMPASASLPVNNTSRSAVADWDPMREFK